jgi:hypothetical protein
MVGLQLRNLVPSGFHGLCQTCCIGCAGFFDGGELCLYLVESFVMRRATGGPHISRTRNPMVARAPIIGFECGFGFVGGALIPLVDLVNVGATGLVSGYGTGAPRDVATLVGVLDG